MIYKFKANVRFRKECDPQQIGEELEAVRVGNGGQLHVENVLAEAINPASPLHPCFTWDNDAAAQSWRSQEARQLIRSVVVLKSEDDLEPIEAFWNVRIQMGDETEQFYQSVSVLEQSPHEYHAALQSLLGQIDALDHSVKSLRRVTPPSLTRQVDQAQTLFQRAKNILNP